jgi:hypothetical protein
MQCSKSALSKRLHWTGIDDLQLVTDGFVQPIEPIYLGLIT